jgi:hypothetical protein
VIPVSTCPLPCTLSPQASPAVVLSSLGREFEQIRRYFDQYRAFCNILANQHAFSNCDNENRQTRHTFWRIEKSALTKERVGTTDVIRRGLDEAQLFPTIYDQTKYGHSANLKLASTAQQRTGQNVAISGHSLWPFRGTCGHQSCEHGGSCHLPTRPRPRLV